MEAGKGVLGCEYNCVCAYSGSTGYSIPTFISPLPKKNKYNISLFVPDVLFPYPTPSKTHDAKKKNRVFT
jgi:hypothetical protein